MNKRLILLGIACLFFSQMAYSAESIKMTGELRALKTDNYSPPKIKRVWQYTIAFLAPDGSIVNPGMPVLMFKTDGIQTKLIDSQGKLNIKKSEIKNNMVNQKELFENKKITIEENKMKLDKATHKSELPQSLLAKNDYAENQLNYELAQKEYKWAKKDYRLAQEKGITEEQILKAVIKKLELEVTGYKNAIKRMKMFAKSEGVVMHKSGWNNNKFAVGDSVYGGQRVVEVANLKQIIAQLKINENNIKHVSEGQKVKLVLDALPDKVFWGRISHLSNVVKIKSKNQPAKILDAEVTIENVDAEIMRPGMRLTAEIAVENQL